MFELFVSMHASMVGKFAHSVKLMILFGFSRIIWKASLMDLSIIKNTEKIPALQWGCLMSMTVTIEETGYALKLSLKTITSTSCVFDHSFPSSVATRSAPPRTIEGRIISIFI